MAALNAASTSTGLKYDARLVFCRGKLDSVKKSSFLPKFSASKESCMIVKEANDSGIVKAVLTPSLGSETRSHRNTDPTSPEFLPIPPFEECFPSSTKEYRLALLMALMPVWVLIEVCMQ